jgi:O-succinylbenzoate synthase
VYLSETTTTCKHILKDFLLPPLINQEVTVESYLADSAYIRDHQLAKHSVESALWDLEAQIQERPLHQLLGGTRTEIPVGESIGVQPSLESLLHIVEKRLKEGYQRIKIKIKPGWDVEPVKAITDAFPSITLMVDANSSYTLEHVDLLKKLDDFNLLMIEQPLAFDDIIDHAQVQKQLRTPICLDESILNAEDARKAIEIGACRIINVKPGRVGGLSECIKINQVAEQHQIALWCGGMLETGLGKAYNLAAASLSAFTLPADIVPTTTFFTEDITTPDVKITTDGTITLPTVAGRGFEVLEAELEKYSHEHFTVT